ncbi:MAG: S-layer homology domain-containing protein, partial [Clostridia bacterium]|nr:S-layer homology domain-containing protein [Clostridia bacterium]
IIGDSTQKTYTFNETISAWGQTLGNYFDSSKVNVVNYSMGGRAMKSNYAEGRFDEILISGKAGDFVFIHSAHNDETISTNRFSRGAGSVANDLTANNENYNKWLNMYVEAIKARGMTPVLVSSMPRIGSNKYSESAAKPNGFNPDSPANMRAKAASDSEVGFVELYAGAKAYMDLVDAKEVTYIYNNIEAGETPAANSANGASGDGTHYKEAASKQWNRIMLQSIYDQSVATTDTYTDKDIMAELVSLMPESVQNAAKTGDWSAVFPEMASDVSAVGIVPGATKQAEENYYYRNNIEKALQLGLIKKDAQNMFKPNEIITVGDFARGAEKAFGLEENSLTSYTKTYAELSQVSTSSVEEAEVIETFADGSADLGEPNLEEGECLVTITQPEGGTVTVYNESAFKTATGDVPASVTASSVIADNDSFTLTAPSEIVSGSDKTGVFADNADISTDYIEFRNSGTKEAVYTAKADGILTVYARTGDNKKVELADVSGAQATQSDYLNEGAGVGTGANVYGVIKFNVKAGTEYQLYTRGGTGRLFGVKYESTDYPQSTDALIVNEGDEVRVVATPATNHMNKSILVDGEEKTTAKEYTFKVTANVTVSAEFISEPALVETTVVASDAALTREIMGAILYDAYLAAYGKNEDGSWNKVSYMNNNGGVPSPDDPNYDPNIKYEGSPYIPLTGWGAVEDLDNLSEDLYGKVKEAYNLGLIRSEDDIARGSISCGSKLEPKAVVTRAKAAKSLVFAFILTQTPNAASQKLPNGNLAAQTVTEIAEPNADAPSTVIK